MAKSAKKTKAAKKVEPRTAMQRYVRSLTPTPIGNIIPQLMARYGFQREIGSEKLQKAWDGLLGDLAGKTRLGATKRGTLEVMVPHGVIVQELTFRNSELVAALKSAVPEEKIQRIRYVIGTLPGGD